MSAPLRASKADLGDGGRRTFSVSRGLEYFTESELQLQVGHGRAAWPTAIMKELIDNSLDACESAGIAPHVDVTVGLTGFSVRDNGPGISASTIKRSLDYMVRVSDKLGYVSPTRGRLGNALKVIWAAPFVATGEGRITVTSHGERHDIRVAVDEIEQVPAIEHRVVPEPDARGTEFTVHWPDLAGLLDPIRPPDSYKTAPSALELVEAFSACNPHASFTLDGETLPATDPGWQHWTGAERLVAEWYTPETFRELVRNYVASERYGAEPITVRAFVATFRGLSSTVKQKHVTAGFKRDYLHDLVVDGSLDSHAIETLLTRMQEASRAPKPSKLGALGREHITRWLIEQAGVAEGSIKYRKKAGTDGHFPYIIEIGFGIAENHRASRRIVTGLNWSPTLDVPAREIHDVLQEMRVDRHDPVVVFIHMSKPSWRYTGRGKERVEL